MNDRYLYRGKRIDNGKWVAGFGTAYLNHWNKDIQEVELRLHLFYVGSGMFNHMEITPDTIGQCVGLKDKNGKLIFEGDIVANKWSDGDIDLYVVVWLDDECSFALEDTKNSKSYYNISDFHDDEYFEENGKGDICLEIIGNIHDNKELL